MLVQADGLSGVSTGTFEAAFSHGRWSFNKLGCVGGFRADVSAAGRAADRARSAPLRLHFASLPLRVR